MEKQMLIKELLQKDKLSYLRFFLQSVSTIV